MNISDISVTFAVFQLLSGWLNRRARENILAMTLTLLVFQILSGWLKEVFLNM